ncbi:hypothetical protein N7530_010329 [Penicillium desertorum]|uniref:Uncharacterized protein n=1 Tax=Penicillium desertorum TaxID=1303715 RepID=A0A9W9WH81_9EURO|nr:hypothetical protein N7530_010329 [Penicillium desertorum]
MTASRGPQIAPIAPFLRRPRPPARLRPAPAPFGWRPLRPPLSPDASVRLYRKDHLPSQVSHALSLLAHPVSFLLALTDLRPIDLQPDALPPSFHRRCRSIRRQGWSSRRGLRRDLVAQGQAF